MVAYACGTPLLTLRGGVNARSGHRSVVELNSIIATYGRGHQAVRQTKIMCRR